MDNWISYIFHTVATFTLGATKPMYAPEPHDVGRHIQAEIQFGGQISIVKTAGPVDPGMFSFSCWVM